jgi:hypothetical protein
MHIVPTNNIFNIEPSVTSWHGHQILIIRSGKKQNWFLSLQKAKLLVHELNKVEHFLSTSGSECYFHIQKREKRYPVLVLQNCITPSERCFNYSIGLHRARLFTYWLPYVLKFCESAGT